MGTCVTGMGEAQMATPLTRSRGGQPSGHAEEPCPDNAQVGTRVTSCRGSPIGDWSHQVNVSLQEHHRHQIQVWFMWERESPGPGETQVRTTVTRSRLRPRWGPRINRADEANVWIKVSGPGECQVGNRVTMSHLCPGGTRVTGSTRGLSEV